jgi:hypothetical protein
MATRIWLTGILALSVLVTLPPPALGQDLRGLHDMTYVSPTWGYSVRWYADEWTIDQETSAGGAESLWLSDSSGNTVGFEGRAEYGGDARSCLDDQLAKVEEAPEISDVTVLQDELGHPQKIFHPWRSWILLLVAYGEAGQTVDQILYLDCRTLRPEEAVFIRYLVAPAATFSNELPQLEILNAALPRSAWAGNIYTGTGLKAAGLDEAAASPLPVDSLWPWVYPDDPKLLASVDGFELGMMTQVDTDLEGLTAVVMVENSGDQPLTIDPSRFSIANDAIVSDPEPDIAPIAATWDDSAATGARTLSPGSWASLTIEFPTLPETRWLSNLVYRDSTLEGGEVTLDCVAACGYGGGGSRPKLRISR